MSINFCAAAKPDDAPPDDDDDPPAGVELLLPPPLFDELEHAASTAHAVSAAPILTRDFTDEPFLIGHDNARGQNERLTPLSLSERPRRDGRLR